MVGFQLGTEGGSQLGTAGGGTLGITGVNWTLNGVEFDASYLLNADIDANTLALTYHVPEREIDEWRAIGDTSGDIQTNTGFAGVFRAFPRGASGVITVEPPPNTSPPFVEQNDFLLSSYSESQIAAHRFEVSVEFQRQTNRNGTVASRTQPASDWSFSLSNSTLEVRNESVSLVDREGTAAGETLQLEIRLTDIQAALMADELDSPGAIVTREIPDAANTRVDELDGGQSVTISSPSDSEVANDTFGVPSWGISYERAGKTNWLFEVTLVTLA